MQPQHNLLNRKHSFHLLKLHRAAQLSQYISVCPHHATSIVRMGGRAFSYQAHLLWNQLPVYVWEADTLSNFKIRLKTFLFDKAYS